MRGPTIADTYHILELVRSVGARYGLRHGAGEVT